MASEADVCLKQQVTLRIRTVYVYAHAKAINTLANPAVFLTCSTIANSAGSAYRTSAEKINSVPSSKKRIRKFRVCSACSILWFAEVSSWRLVSITACYERYRSAVFPPCDSWCTTIQRVTNSISYWPQRRNTIPEGSVSLVESASRG